MSACPQLDVILQFAVRNGVSDVHLKPYRPPYFRKDGRLVTQKGAPNLSAELVDRFVEAVVPPARRAELASRGDLDTSYELAEVARFRVNVFRQRDRHALVFRVVPRVVKRIEELGLPPVVAKIAEEPRGLVLVTGATGSGKSTTMAAMVQHINATRATHIVTIEDPIEYVFEEQRAIINQREVGSDAETFARALRAALRQDPDVILVGEMRDVETIETALHAAETGHLVISTLHTIDAVETVHRIVAVFPPHQQRTVRLLVASVLSAVISQRLVRRKDGRGRVPAVEVLRSTELVRDILRDEGRLSELRDAMARGRETYGMQTFDQSLFDLYSNDLVSYDDALRESTNPSDFALKASGISGSGGTG